MARQVKINAARLRALLAVTRISHVEIAKRFGFTHTAVTRWALGQARPTIDMVHELEDLLGVRRGFLTEGGGAENGALVATVLAELAHGHGRSGRPCSDVDVAGSRS
jgi:transcriptional regulator with XRE-family HTH domain